MTDKLKNAIEDLEEIVENSYDESIALAVASMKTVRYFIQLKSHARVRAGYIQATFDSYKKEVLKHEKD